MAYERSMDFPESMSDEDIRTYVQEREVDLYGATLAGTIEIRTDNGNKRATWSTE